MRKRNREKEDVSLRAIKVTSWAPTTNAARCTAGYSINIYLAIIRNSHFPLPTTHDSTRPLRRREEIEQQKERRKMIGWGRWHAGAFSRPIEEGSSLEANSSAPLFSLRFRAHAIDRKNFYLQDPLVLNIYLWGFLCRIDANNFYSGFQSTGMINW